MILGFTSAVVASEGRVSERPLDDWLEPNYAAFPWGAENWAFSDFVSPESWLVCKMGLPWPKSGLPDFPGIKFDMVYENSLVEGVTVITGLITERSLDDGSALITLHLDVKNAPLTVYNVFEFLGYCYNRTAWYPYPGIPPSAILGAEEDGYIDYKVVCKFYISEPGAALPDHNGLWNNYISVNIIGTGYGTLTEHAVELGFANTAGALGMVRLHQIALFKPNLKDTHPNYDPDFGDLWPVETIEIFEIG